MAKEGSVVSGLMDSFATSISLALQYGVPLQVLVDKFSHTRFEPSGFTGNPDIPIAKSITDYIFRWLSLKFDKPALEEGEATRSRPAAGGPGAAHAAGRGREPAGGRAAAGVPEPAGRAALPHLRGDHVPERRLLQMQQLRRHQRLQLNDARRRRCVDGRCFRTPGTSSPGSSGRPRRRRPGRWRSSSLAGSSSTFPSARDLGNRERPGAFNAVRGWFVGRLAR